MLACNIDAIWPEQRPRYNELVKTLRNSIRERRELPEGYAFLLDGSSISLSAIGEWMEMERLCCPFFSFQLEVVGSNRDCWLNLTGPDGSKPILDSAFANS